MTGAPKPGTVVSLLAVMAIWIGMLFYDILIRGYMSPTLEDQSFIRSLLPIVGLIPFFLRWLKPTDLQSDTEVYEAFRRLSINLMVSAMAIGLMNILPIEYDPDGAPKGLFSFIGGRIGGLILLIAVPVIVEQLLLVLRYRSRRSVPVIARYVAYGLILAVVVGQFITPDDGISAGSFPIVLGGILAFLTLLLIRRTGWLINLRKKQKFGLVGLAFVGMICCTTLIDIGRNSSLGRGVLAMSSGLETLLIAMLLPALILEVKLFFSGLIALPTAEAIDRRNKEVSSLANFGRLLTQSFDFKELTEAAISITCDVTQGTTAWIESGNGIDREVLYSEKSTVPHFVTNGLMQAKVARDVSLSQSVQALKKIQVLEKVSGAKWTSGPGEVKEIRSVAAAPLQAGEDLFGTLYVAKDKVEGFDREDLAILGAVANQISLAIDHARLIQGSLERERFEQEMMIARDLQQRLLPKLMPASPFYEIYAESEPASIVGGDYYDVVSFNDRTLGLLVADVSGKGASAALYMGMTKGIIQALSGTCASPKDLMAQANLALHGNIDQRWFVTMTCAQIIETERKLRISRAGHCPTLMVRGGVASYSKPRGLGLAIARPAIFDRNLELEEVQFAPGDYVIFLSDGIPEAHDPHGEEFGYERLQAVVESAARSAPSTHGLREAIFREITTFMQGEPLGDDCTIVILRWQ
jgi:serine phosphatase RsbU (regulator of sigma subunit)